MIFPFICGTGAAGKKNRLKERRLMKGFNLSTSGLGTSVGGGPTPAPPGSGKNRLQLKLVFFALC